MPALPVRPQARLCQKEQKASLIREATRQYVSDRPQPVEGLNSFWPSSSSRTRRLDVIDLVEEAHGAIFAWIQEVVPDPRTHRVMDPAAPTDQQGTHADLSCYYIRVGGPLRARAAHSCLMNQHSRLRVISATQILYYLRVWPPGAHTTFGSTGTLGAGAPP